MYGFTLLAAMTANTDLFNEQWTTGNLYSIQPVVNVLSTVSVWVISIVGFGIVIFSILKNALSGLYVINPNLWDKVDDVKNQMVSGISGTIQSAAGAVPGRGNAIAQRLGGAATFLLSLIPNVKALTDFDDGVPVDKKQYFMRSIPLLVFQIFIGTFIFLGYPSKIANWIGGAGTYVVDAMIRNVDPVEIIKGVSDKITVYELATDGSPDPLDKVVNSATDKAMSTISTRYSSAQREPLQETAYAVERYLLNVLASTTDTLGAADGYDINIQVTPYNGIPQVSSAFSYQNGSSATTNPLVMARATNGITQYKTWVNANSLPIGVPDIGADDYIMWTITATPVAVSKTSSASMIVCAGYQANVQSASGNINVKLVGITIGNGASDLRGTPGPVTVDFIDANGSAVASSGATLQTTSINVTSNAPAMLTFSQSQWDSIKQYIAQGGCAYMSINLSGNWSMDVQRAGQGNNNVTIPVSQLRLATGNSSASYALTTWSDFTLQNYNTNYSNPSDILDKSSMTE